MQGDEEQTTRKPQCWGGREKGNPRGEKDFANKKPAAYAAVVAPATGPDDALLLSSMLWKSRISEYIICNHRHAEGRRSV